MIIIFGSQIIANSLLLICLGGAGFFWFMWGEGAPNSMGEWMLCIITHINYLIILFLSLVYWQSGTEGLNQILK